MRRSVAIELLFATIRASGRGRPRVLRRQRLRTAIATLLVIFTLVAARRAASVNGVPLPEPPPGAGRGAATGRQRGRRAKG
jgi:hypothetical protein